jgi:hypothetical protein
MIYVCGDSFAVPDTDYGPCWIDLLKEKTNVTTLAQVCTSNLLVAQQVDHAIQQNPSAIIVLFTSSTRGQTRNHGNIVPYSIHSLDSMTSFSQQQLTILKNYTAEFFDLELAIYENQLIIEAVLHRLVNSGITFQFDQGGFEHPSYGGQQTYFQEFDKWRSSLNLWDYTTTREYRPYYHIKDHAVHEHIAKYYYEHFKQT